MKGREFQELRVALGYSLEELSRILKQARIAPLLRGKSRQSLHRMEKLADAEVEPPELVEWLLALKPLPEARQAYDEYLARKAARAAQASIAASAPVPAAPVLAASPTPTVPPPPVSVPVSASGPPPVPGGVMGNAAPVDPPPSLRGLMVVVALLTVSVFLLFLTQLIHLASLESEEEGLMTSRMGRKQGPFPIPNTPLKGQMKGHCDAPALLINGGCWYGGREGPCAPREFEHGSRCYLPVAEDPTTPVSMDSLDGGFADPP